MINATHELSEETVTAMNYLLCILFFLTVSSKAIAGDQIAHSSQANRIAIGRSNGQIELRDGTTGDLKVSMRHEGVPEFDEDAPRSSGNWTPHCVFSSDGKVLATSSGYAPVILWEAKTGKKIRQLAGSSVGYDLTFSDDGSRMIGIGIDGLAGPRRLTLWDTESGEIIRELTIDIQRNVKAYEGRFFNVKFAETGFMLLIESVEKNKNYLRIWNTESGSETIKQITDTRILQRSILSKDGKRLIIQDNTRVPAYTLWDTTSGELIKLWKEEGSAINQ